MDDKERIEKLIARLSSKDKAVRILTIQELRRIVEVGFDITPAIPALADTLLDAPQAVSYGEITALQSVVEILEYAANMGGDISCAIENLAMMLERNESWIAEAAADTLGKAVNTGTDISSAFPALVNAIFRKYDLRGKLKEKVEYAIVTAINQGADISEVTEQLIRAFESEYQIIQDYATRIFKTALREKHGDKILQLLIEALQIDNTEVKYGILELFRQINVSGRPKDISPAKKVLLELLDDQDFSMRISVIVAIEGISSPKVVKALVDLLEKEKHEEVIGYILAALGKIGNKEVGDLLIEQLKCRDMEIRKAAVEAITKLIDRGVNIDTESVITVLYEIAEKPGVGKNEIAGYYNQISNAVRKRRNRIDRGKLSEGKPKPPVGEKRRLVRVRSLAR